MNKDNFILKSLNVNKSFGAVTAAKNVNINVEVGEKISLIGSNGAGKTTFMNIVTGYLKPDYGKIYFDGKDITNLNPRTICEMGISRSFQIPQIFETMTPWENLLVSVGSSKNSYSFFKKAVTQNHMDIVGDILERFSLEQFADRIVSELPGGVRKLLDIAMAITRQPKILLLDEPTSGVGTEEKYPLMDTIIRALSDTSLTTIFVEHDMDIVQRYSNRVIAFYQGEIIADNSCENVLSDRNVKKFVTGERKV